jgi:hypothetical protein
MRLAVGIVLALGSALALNWGFFVQHGATNTLPRLTVRRPIHSLWALFSNWRWLTGYLVGMGGWGLYIVALLFAPLSIVQAVAAGGVGVLALLVWRLEREDLTRRDATAVGACIAGLVLLLVSFAGGVPRQHAPGHVGLYVWVGALAAVAAISWSAGARVMRAGAGLGAAAGLLYAAGDVSTKGAETATLIFIPVLIACQVLGFVALQMAFQRGGALATAGTCTLLNNSIPIIAGVVAFQEHVPRNGFGVLRVLSFALTVAGAAMLARPEKEVLEPQAPDAAERTLARS